MPSHLPASSDRLTVTPKEVHADDPMVKTSAGLLIAAARSGLPVAPRLIVLPAAFTAFLHESNVANEIRVTCRNPNPGDIQSVQNIARRLQNRIIKTAFPSSLYRQLAQTYHRIIGHRWALLAPISPVPDLSPALPRPDRLFRGDSVFVTLLRDWWASLLTPHHVFAVSRGLASPLPVPPLLAVIGLPAVRVSGTFTTSSPHQKSAVTVQTVHGASALFAANTIVADHDSLDRVTGKILHHHPIGQTRQLAVDRHGHLVTQTVNPKSVTAAKLSPGGFTQVATLARHLHNLALQPVAASFVFDGKRVWLTHACPHADETVTLTPSASPSLKPQVLAQGTACSRGIIQAPLHYVASATEKCHDHTGRIFVIPSASAEFVPVIKHAGGVISLTGSLTSHLAIIARELGVPMVSGVSRETLAVPDNTVITLNGHTGQILRGGLPPAEPDSAATGTLHTPLATKLYLSVTDPAHAFTHPLHPVDGLAVQGSVLLSLYGHHPKSLRDRHALKDFQEYLTAKLTAIAAAATDSPVWYLLTDLQTGDYRHLAGGDRFEPVEANPFIGWRGSARLLQDSTVLDTEMAVIKHLRRDGYKNIQVVIPFIRSLAEMVAIKRHLAAASLTRGPSLKIMASVDTPAGLLSLADTIAAGVDGLSINLDHLVPMMLGIDPAATDLQHHLDPRHPAIENSLRFSLEVALRQSCPVNIRGYLLTKYPDLTHSLVRWGAHSLTATVNDLPLVRQLVGTAELELAKRAATPYTEHSS